MNRSFRLVFNACTGVWQAVSEHVSGKRKGKSGAVQLMAAVVMAGAGQMAMAADAMNPIEIGLNEVSSVSNLIGINGAGNIFVGNGTLNGVKSAVVINEAGVFNYLDALVQGRATEAFGVNSTGNVVVGAAELGNYNVAVRWKDEKIQSLASGNFTQYSSANAVNANGNVVVGFGTDVVAGFDHAFRWTEESQTMTSLGTLTGEKSEYSSATGVNAKGDVVVGYGHDSLADGVRAFRWTEASGKMVSLASGNFTEGDSSAKGVNAKGDMVVGVGYDSSTKYFVAFRWTEASNTMTSLASGQFTGSSRANAVNAAGNVVVGIADNVVEKKNQAFRWTAANGIQSIETWLADNGVKVGAGMDTEEATAVNAEGNVITGRLYNNNAFIARVGSGGSGMIDVADFNAGLSRVAASGSVAQSNTDMILNGMHSTPMKMLLETGKNGFWTSGDFGRQEREARQSDMVIGEIGYGYRFNDTVQLNLAAGHSYSKTGTDHGGETRIKGNYILPELIVTLPGSVYATVAGFYSQGRADINRGYLNAGTPIIAKGDPSVRTVGASLRLDWLNASQVAGITLTPYAALAYAQTKLDGYTENGNGFPVRWDQRKEKSTTARVGIDLTRPVGETVKLQGRVEGVHRFEKDSAASTGEIIGLNPFSFAGQQLKQNWLRIGAGAEGKVGSGVLSAMLNGTTAGEAASYWLAVNYRFVF